MLKGGCFCKKVRYEILGTPFDSTICHCVDCRRISGAPFVAWFSVAQSAFRIVLGEPKVLASSQAVVRAFCADCGTHLTYRHSDFPGEIDISTCSLDTPEQVPPRHHTWTLQRVPWVRVSDGLPRHAGSYNSPTR